MNTQTEYIQTDLSPILKMIIQNKDTKAQVRNIIGNPLNYLLEHIAEVRNELGGKGAGLIALSYLAESYGFQVPQFECIGIQCLGKKYYGLNNFDFDPDDLRFLENIFIKFQTSYLAVRSSGENEDGAERNFSGAFHTGFCRGNDFSNFCEQVKKVILSGNSVSPTALMGVVVMEVVGEFDENGNYAPDAGGVMATTNFGDRVTISGEFGLPIGITSGLGSGITIDFNKNGTPLHILVDEYQSHHYNEIQSKAMMTPDGTIQYFTGNKIIPNKIHEGLYGIFSKEIYRTLVGLAYELEFTWKTALDIEFVVHKNQIYLIQCRKYPNDYKRPQEMLTFPKMEPERIILNKEMMLSCCGFLNNVALINENLILTGEWGDCQERRCRDKKAILHFLVELEKKHQGKKYMVGVDRLEAFPEINKEDFPGLALIYFPDTDGNHHLSHAYMLLREYRIPHIISNYMGFYNLNDAKDKELIVYLDGNEKGIIYLHPFEKYKANENKYYEEY